eukprot:TRINITY_DN101207_c0_g1_i1.p1 TRINITY_DN101207_c0_g1~~TRINITY_DN101207_c0_g1_i1.p1  ORF type:complete len:264 (-),score=92.29 TRINITY_DN101207_c0_g1_i1:80-871(-)
MLSFSILDEFSSLNALSHHVVAPPPIFDERQVGIDEEDHLLPPGTDIEELVFSAESLVRLINEASNHSDRSGAHFLADQLGISHVLSEATAEDDRERLLTRLDNCERAHAASLRVASTKLMQFDESKYKLKQEQEKDTAVFARAKKETEKRWGRKLKKSPFAIDLVADEGRIFEEQRHLYEVETRQRRLEAQKAREEHNAVFQQPIDSPAALAAERRAAIDEEKRQRVLQKLEQKRHAALSAAGAAASKGLASAPLAKQGADA